MRITIIYIVSFIILSMNCSIRQTNLLVGTSVNVLNKDSLDQFSLHEAVRMNDLALVKKLIKNDASLFERDSDNAVPMIYACNTDSVNMEVIKLLVGDGQTFFIRDTHFYSSLDYCIERNHLEVIQYMMNEYGNILREKLNKDNIYFDWCILSENVEAIKMFLPLMEDINRVDFKGRSIVESSIEHSSYLEKLKSSTYEWPRKKAIDLASSLEITKFLIDEGAKMNLPGARDFIFSVASGSPEVMKLIIENGFDVKSDVQVHDKTYNSIRYFLKNVGYNNIIRVAHEEVRTINVKRFKGCLEILDLMTANGASLDSDFDNPYHFLLTEAVLSNNVKMVETLIETNRDIKKETLDGRNLSDVALEKGFTEIAEVLKTK